MSAVAEHSTYVAAPTGWHRDLVSDYVDYVLHQRGEVPEHCALTVHLLDCDDNDDHTTTWRVRYHLHLQQAEREGMRPLSLSPRPETKRSRQRRLH